MQNPTSAKCVEWVSIILQIQTWKSSWSHHWLDPRDQCRHLVYWQWGGSNSLERGGTCCVQKTSQNHDSSWTNPEKYTKVTSTMYSYTYQQLIQLDTTGLKAGRNYEGHLNDVFIHYTSSWTLWFVLHKQGVYSSDTHGLDKGLHGFCMHM